VTTVGYKVTELQTCYWSGQHVPRFRIVSETNSYVWNKEYHHGQYRRIQNLPGNEISSDVRYILHFVTATLVELTREFRSDKGEISDYFFH